MNLLDEHQNKSNGNNEKDDLILDIRTMAFCFSGILPNKGLGPYSIDTESITLKPFFTGSKHVNRAAEVCLVSGFPEYKPFSMPLLIITLKIFLAIIILRAE